VVLSVPRDWQTVATYHTALDFPEFVGKKAGPHVCAVRVDLTSRAEVHEVLAGTFDCCLFLAANGDPARSVAQPAFDLVSNTLSLVHVLELVHVRRLVLFSSGAVYDGLSGDVSPASAVSPLLPYGISKLAAEKYGLHF